MKTTKKASAPTKRENAAPKATQEKKPTAEKPTTATTATQATPTTGEAPTAPTDSKKETPTMKPDTKPETANAADNADKATDPAAAAAAVIPAQEAKPARKYTAEEAKTPQAAEALHRTIIRAAAAAETAPTAAQLEAYETELRAEAAALHGKAPRWTESHSLARLCYQLGLAPEEAAKAKTKTDNKKALIAAAKSHITPALAWKAIEGMAADRAAQKAIYQLLVDAAEGMATTATLYKAYVDEARKGGEAAGVLPTKSEAAKERAALRKAIDRRAKQRSAAEAIYYRHLAAALEEGAPAAAARAAALAEAAAYLRDDLALDAAEAAAVWEEAAKAYIPDPAFNADKAAK